MAIRGMLTPPGFPTQIDTYVRLSDARISLRVIHKDSETGTIHETPQKRYTMFITVDWLPAGQDGPSGGPYRHDQHELMASGVELGAVAAGSADTQVMKIAYALLKTSAIYQGCTDV